VFVNLWQRVRRMSVPLGGTFVTGVWLASREYMHGWVFFFVQLCVVHAADASAAGAVLIVCVCAQVSARVDVYEAEVRTPFGNSVVTAHST
jgi:hypothetical protein